MDELPHHLDHDTDFYARAPLPARQPRCVRRPVGDPPYPGGPPAGRCRWAPRRRRRARSLPPAP